uniref:Succinate dehydrogenase assembly factor 3 n=1 Tax=Scophthalmus maximus TaxID=52904 RepID=A0A8D3AYZ6_SCOMX
MAASAHVSGVRSLYKRILVLHRFLPIDLRALGDQYVKDEFRRHRGASAAEAKGFVAEWQVTAHVANNRGGGINFTIGASFGADLSDRKLSDFQEDQIGQLYELMLESTKPNRQFDIQEDGNPPSF